MSITDLRNPGDHPSWKSYRITMRSGRVFLINAPSEASAREQVLRRGDVMDPKGPKIVRTESTS